MVASLLIKDIVHNHAHKCNENYNEIIPNREYTEDISYKNQTLGKRLRSDSAATSSYIILFR